MDHAVMKIRQGEIKHDMSLQVIGNVIFTCQLSSSMELITLESCSDDKDCSFLWNDGDESCSERLGDEHRHCID